MKYILSDRTVDRFVKYGVNVFGIDKTLDKYEIANQAIEATYHFFESIGIPMHLKDVGIDDSRLEEMANHIASDGGGVGLSKAYVPLGVEDLVKILTASL
jgi:alcohol dehydrogenase YqhD (iron-dependent ADH family)